jgi:hypothetical protein
MRILKQFVLNVIRKILKDGSHCSMHPAMVTASLGETIAVDVLVDPAAPVDQIKWKNIP